VVLIIYILEAIVISLLVYAIVKKMINHGIKKAKPKNYKGVWYCQKCGEEQRDNIGNVVYYPENPNFEVRICNKCLKERKE
jgi:hypothetical protein